MAYSSYHSVVSPGTNIPEALVYIESAPGSPLTEYSQATPSPVSTVSGLTPSSAVVDNWSSMSHISRSHTVTELDVEPIARHPAYYIPSGDVVFLAGAQLFRVHRYFFVRESVKFRDMLSLVTSSGTELMGSSDSRAIPLSDVTKEEFESFLWVFYNDDYEYEALIEKWSAILRLAHMWQFPKVKELAIRNMDKLYVTPVDKAVMARDYEVDPARGWLDQAYAALGAREESISKAEGLRLGLDVVLLLAELREKIRKRRFEEEKKVTTSQHESKTSIFGSSHPFSKSSDGFGYRAPSRLSCSSRHTMNVSPAPSEQVLEEQCSPGNVKADAAGYTDEDLEDARSVFKL